MRYLLDVGYRVIPVRPLDCDEVHGVPCVATLAEIDEPIDLVDVFRRPEFCAATRARPSLPARRRSGYRSGSSRPRHAGSPRATGSTTSRTPAPWSCIGFTWPDEPGLLETEVRHALLAPSRVGTAGREAGSSVSQGHAPARAAAAVAAARLSPRSTMAGNGVGGSPVGRARDVRPRGHLRVHGVPPGRRGGSRGGHGGRHVRPTRVPAADEPPRRDRREDRAAVHALEGRGRRGLRVCGRRRAASAGPSAPGLPERLLRRLPRARGRSERADDLRLQRMRLDRRARAQVRPPPRQLRHPARRRAVRSCSAPTSPSPTCSSRTTPPS